MRMKIRIVEFKVSTDDSEEKFFIETGEVIWEKAFTLLFIIPIFLPKTIWTKDAKEDQQKNLVPIGHKTFQEAMTRVHEIKRQLPTYHQIA